MSIDSPADPSEAVPEDRIPPAIGRSPRRWIRGAAFFFIAMMGLIIRLPRLNERPMHTDEAVNAYIVGQLLSGDSFKYDPHDRHGPLLAALALPLMRLQGAQKLSDLSESQVRVTNVLAGTVTILLFGAASEIWGFLPCALAALLFACAPLSVYYDRYFIHESLFVALTYAFLLSAWRVWRTGSTLMLVSCAAIAAMMFACKETAVLQLFAVSVAAFITWRVKGRIKTRAALLQPVKILIALLVFVTVTALLFTWFGRNWGALVMLPSAIANALTRASGEGHEKPFWYFAQLLATGWSGKIILAIASVGLLQALMRNASAASRFLVIYFLCSAILFSSIPYKTPWLALNLWLPIALFCGKALDYLLHVILDHSAKRVLIPVFCILAGIAIAVIANDTRQRVLLQPADEANPYAYAHTSEDLLGLPIEIERLAKQNGIATPRIAVIAADPWPLPWYLRKYHEVGYWQPGQHPEKADFYITSTEVAEEYAPRLQNFRSEFFGARPGVLILLWSPATN